MKRSKILIFILILSIKSMFANQDELDSLLYLIDRSANDIEKVELLNELSNSIKFSDSPYALEANKQALEISNSLENDSLIALTYYCQSAVYEVMGEINLAHESLINALMIYKKLKDEHQVANVNNHIGILHDDAGDLDKAEYFYKKALELRLGLKDSIGVAKVYKNLGIAYKSRGMYKEALEYYHQSFSIFEQLDQKYSMGRLLYSIGNIYRLQKMHDISMDHYNRSVEIMKELGQQKYLAYNYIGIGILLKIQEDYEGALKAYQQSYRILDSLGMKKNASDAVNNIANIYDDLGDFIMAKKFHLKAIVMREKINYRSGLAGSYVNLGAVYFKLGQSDKSEFWLLKGLNLADTLESKLTIVDGHDGLASLYSNNKKYDKAYYHQYMHDSLSRHLFNENNTKALAEMEAKYNAEKQSQKIEILLQKSKVETYKKYGIIGILTIGILVLGGSVYWLFRRNQKKEEVNESLSIKNDEISMQRDEIESKNSDIMASIRYAKGIQQAILPGEEKRLLLSNSFVYYKPRDIVSGDFYWIEKKNGAVYFAVVDCTGHGVPGAFMSIIGHQALTDAVMNFDLTDPGEILNSVNENVNIRLKQSHKASLVKDGMDLFLVKLSDNKLEYCGAMNDAIVIRDNKIHTLKGERATIGGFIEDDQTKNFNTSYFDYHTGDLLYLYSDGIYDQFGGESGKKMKKRRFRDLIVSISNSRINEQGVLFEKMMNNWMGSHEQIDDMCLLGVELQ